MPAPQPPPKLPQAIGVREFRGNMTGYLLQVRQGASFLITSHGEVVAEINPPATLEPSHRQPGILRGKIHMSPHFDTLPEDILASMEGG